MKFILVPILIALLFTQTFSKWVIMIEYNLNRDFIASNLCVNKARPKLHCNGKCQMMKKLAEEEKQNSSNHNSAKISIQDLFFSNDITQPELPSLKSTPLSFNEEPPIPNYSSPIASIFHPPAMV
jgi:hypothetical protein